MKKLLTKPAFFAMAVSFGLMLFVSPAYPEIVGSAHDFSGEGWNTSGEICITCHTTHNADTSVTDAPLWNHDVTTATYSLYASATLDVTLGQPDGISKLCLSCHDGTVAIDSYGENAGSTFLVGGDNLGSNLANDHPISFTYDSSLATADGELYDPSIEVTALGDTIEADLLFSGKVECASCHDVHNTVSEGNDSLLVITNAGSALCITCHDK